MLSARGAGRLVGGWLSSQQITTRSATTKLQHTTRVPCHQPHRQLALYTITSDKTQSRVLPSASGTYCIQQRWKSKNKAKKDKKGKSAGAGSIGLSEEEINEVIDFDSMKGSMDTCVEKLQRQYYEQLSVRSSHGILDNLPVKTSDGSFSLMQLAQITQKNPQMVIVDMSTAPQYIPDIKRSIENSGLDLNPQQEGTTLYVPIPKVTREKRETFAKNAKLMMNKSKDELRHIQQEYMKILKRDSKGISADVQHKLKELIQSTTKSYGNKLEDVMKEKQDELLKE